MRTIESFVRDGIEDISALHEALALAMKLEFSTIPPYLCAQWSIRDDPSRVERTLHEIVSQEMQHLALAGNLLAALGGRPHLATPGFLTAYPTTVLPGDIALDSPLDLTGLTPEQLAVFMNVEKPAFPPVALTESAAPTIGAFYDGIIDTLTALDPPIDVGAGRIEIPHYPTIESVGDAVRTIERIKQEGEGLETSPEQPLSEREAFAHYYRFKEIAVGKRLEFDGIRWSFSGSPITMPGVWAFGDVAATASEASEFQELLVQLLQGLEACWAVSAPFEVTRMFRLEVSGRALIRCGVAPPFGYPEGAAED